MIESVIATPLFLVLVFGGLKLMLTAWQMLSIQFVTTQVMREVAIQRCFISTGPSAPDKIGSECAAGEIVKHAREYGRLRAKLFGLTLTDTNSRICVITNDADFANFDVYTKTCGGSSETSAGTAGMVAGVFINYQAPLFFGDFMKLLSPIGGPLAPIDLRGLSVGRIERGR